MNHQDTKGTKVGTRRFFLLPFLILTLAFSAAAKETPTGLSFSHKLHLGRGFGCELCHLAQSYTEPTRPPEMVCSYCHVTRYVAGEAESASPTAHQAKSPAAGSQASAKCGQCHTRADYSTASVVRPTFTDSKFTHAPHLAAGVECRRCHAKLERCKRGQDIEYMHMPECLACHTERNVPRQCSTCHTRQREDVKPPSHDGQWLQKHGHQAEFEAEQSCNHCHPKQDFCQSCHQASPPRSHTVFFRERGHGFYAENDRMTCEPCHQQDFCLRCHNTENGVKPASHTVVFGGQRPYLHCASCHFPAGEANGCNACHHADRINERHLEAVEQRNVLQVPDAAFQLSHDCLGACHPYNFRPPHHPLATLVDGDCLICHRH